MDASMSSRAESNRSSSMNRLFVDSRLDNRDETCCGRIRCRMTDIAQ